jgi:hypothetical protein
MRLLATFICTDIKEEKQEIIRRIFRIRRDGRGFYNEAS